VVRKHGTQAVCPNQFLSTISSENVGNDKLLGHGLDCIVETAPLLGAWQVRHLNDGHWVDFRIH
jgi:hypothetical protein